MRLDIGTHHMKVGGLLCGFNIHIREEVYDHKYSFKTHILRKIDKPIIGYILEKKITDYTFDHNKMVYHQDVFKIKWISNPFKYSEIINSEFIVKTLHEYANYYPTKESQ